MELFKTWGALLIAAYGALLSTALFVRTVLRERRDKGHLSVYAMLAENTDGAKNFISIRVTNVGTKRTQLTHVCGCFPPRTWRFWRLRRGARYGRHFLLPAAAPRWLEPGEQFMATIGNPIDDFKSDITKLYAATSVGDEYYVPASVMRTLNRRLNKARAAGEKSIAPSY